jgi:hypothetical protein
LDEGMADPPNYPGSTTGTPRWVKVFAAIALVIVVLFVVLLLTGGHGPRRHTLSGAVAGHGPLSGVTERGGHQP